MSNKKLRTLAALTSALIAANAGTFAASADSSAGFNSVIKAPETDNISYISGEYSTLPQIKDTDRYELSIESQPEKTVYLTGEELDLTGLEFCCLHQSDPSAEIWEGDYFDTYETPLSELIESGKIIIDDSEFDNTKAGTYTIYVHYGTATDSFNVVVTDEETAPSDELTIHCYPFRIDYDLNMALDLSGAVVSGSYGENNEFHGEYLTDMIEKGIIDVDCSEYNSSEIGAYKIYIILGTAVESFEVRVGCPLVQNILNIETLPIKTEYNYGEELDLTGAEVYCWARGDGGTIPDTDFTADLQTLVDNETIKIDYSEFYETKSGTCTIYLNYGHARASFEVTVNGEESLPTGDANGDGEFTIADMVSVQNNLLGKKTAKLADWKAADLYPDGKIDVYDFIVMRSEFIKNFK